MATTYTNYLGRYGKTQLWKFGETTHTTQREYNIRQTAQQKGVRSANNFKFVEISNIAVSKAQSVLIESVIRATLESKGYKLEGNDHFRTTKKASEVYADYHEAMTKAMEVVTAVYDA